MTTDSSRPRSCRNTLAEGVRTLAELEKLRLWCQPSALRIAARREALFRSAKASGREAQVVGMSWGRKPLASNGSCLGGARLQEKALHTCPAFGQEGDP